MEFNSPNGSSASPKNVSTLLNCQAQSSQKIPKVIADGLVSDASHQQKNKVLSHSHLFPMHSRHVSMSIFGHLHLCMLKVKRCCKIHQNVLILSYIINISLLIFPPIFLDVAVLHFKVHLWPLAVPKRIFILMKASHII